MLLTAFLYKLQCANLAEQLAMRGYENFTVLRHAVTVDAESGPNDVDADGGTTEKLMMASLGLNALFLLVLLLRTRGHPRGF